MPMKKIDSPHRQWTNARHMFWSKSAVHLSSSLRIMGVPVKLASALTLLTFGALLTGCSATQPLLCKPAEPVLMPALSQPLPLVSYTSQAKQRIEISRKKLTDMSATFKP